MGLHNTAHYLKSKGRGTDTELVHMSKREIKGLQQLAMAHGGSLTVNPDTGLVEAGFLEQALPIVAAAAATYFTAGAAAPALTAALGSSMAGGIAAGALAGAGISGLTAAVTGKDVGKAALMGGVGGAISGGLGAYGEAPNLLADATQKTAETAGTEAATSALKEGTTEAVASGYGEAVQGPMTQQQFSDVSAFTGTPQAPGSVPAGMPSPTIPSTPTGSELTALQAGGPQAPNAIPGAPDTYYGQLKPDQYIQKAGILALPTAGLLEQEQQEQLGPQEEPSTLARLSPNFQAYTPPQPNPYYRAKYPTYAEGGITQSYAVGGNVAAAPTGPVERLSQNVMGGANNMYPQSQQIPTRFATPTQMPVSSEMVQQNEYNGVTMAKGGLPSDAPRLSDIKMFTDSDTNTRGLNAFDAAKYRTKKLMDKSGIKMAELPKTGIKSLGGDFSDMAARGGIAHLGDYSDGGRLLKGPGDGMSDNIPATIGRKQPARLADGEFVVPADVVSHLGNGSTDAGAKKLYAMMDKIRRARTGKKKQAPAVKADKYLPA